jgi:hypothetical protein
MGSFGRARHLPMDGRRWGAFLAGSLRQSGLTAPGPGADRQLFGCAKRKAALRIRPS